MSLLSSVETNGRCSKGESLSGAAKERCPKGETLSGSAKEWRPKVETLSGAAKEWTPKNETLSSAAKEWIPKDETLNNAANDSRSTHGVSPLSQLLATNDYAVTTAQHSRVNSLTLCRFFQQGACKKGHECAFVHDTALQSSSLAQNFSFPQAHHAEIYSKPAVPICRFFQRGLCKKGLECPFLHETARHSGCDLVSKKSHVESDNLTQFIQLEDGISCKFGPGMTVVDLQLGEDQSPTIIVSGLSNLVTEQDVEARLSPFGTLISLILSQNFATATFENGTMAQAAAEALHGTSNESWIGLVGKNIFKERDKACQTSVAVRIKTDSTSRRNRGATVKVQWYAPSRCAWVSFQRKHDAEKAATLCHKKTFRGRVIESNFQQTLHYHSGSFSIWIGNVDEFATKAGIKSFVESETRFRVLSVNLGDLPYTRKSAISTVQKLLVTHGGPLLQFEPADWNTEKSPLKQKALAIFANSSDAAKASEYFKQNTKLADLGGSRLFLQRIFTLKYSAPAVIAHAIKSEIELALNENARETSIRYSLFSGKLGGSTSITITADEEAVLLGMKEDLDSILRGQVVRDDNHRVLWNRYVTSKRFLDDFRQHVGSDVVYLWLDKRRQQVRVFGKDDRHREHLAAQVKNLCQDAEIETHAMPIPQADYEKVLLSGRGILDRVMRTTRCRKVSLDIRNRSLLVEGTTETAVQAKDFLSKLLRDTTVGGKIDGDHCPICFCPPETATRLQCGHIYCKDCFQTWLTGDNLCDFPLMCLSDECRAPISLVDLKELLLPEDYTGILRKALDDHVRKTASIQFCLTPTCSGLFTTAEGQRLSSCSTCLETICNECKAMHGTISCRDYRLTALPPDRLRMKIIDEILTLRCPRCNQVFLDFDGCFALRCSVCPCHFCGWCLKDCGVENAHPHVATCPQKLGKETYFGTRQQFELAQNKKRINELRNFLSNFTVQERESIVTSITQDLSDLGISTKALQ